MNLKLSPHDLLDFMGVYERLLKEAQEFKRTFKPSKKAQVTPVDYDKTIKWFQEVRDQNNLLN